MGNEYISKAEKDYISREAAIIGLAASSLMPHQIDDAAEALQLVPAADVAEVRHGRWLSMDEKEDVIELDNNGCPVDSCRCSECGDWLRCSDEFIVRGRYCPNCGAKMEGWQDDD